MASQTVQKGYGGTAKFTVLASAARTTTQTSDDYTVPYAKNLRLVLDVTSITSAPTLTVTVDGKTPLGIYFNLLTANAVVATGTTVLEIGQGITAVTGGKSADVLPNVFRIVVTVSNSNSATYSLEAEAV